MGENSDIKVAFRCVRYTATCPVWDVSGCIKDGSAGEEPICQDKLQKCLYAGDTLKYDVQGSADVLSSSKYVVNGTITVENLIDSEISIVSAKINTNGYPLNPATINDDIILENKGDIEALVFTGFLGSKTIESCSNNKLSFNFDILYQVDNGQVITLSLKYEGDNLCEDLSCECQDNTWKFCYTLDGETTPTECNDITEYSPDGTVIDIEDETITVGEVTNGVTSCSSTPSTKSYVFSVTPKDDSQGCGPKSCNDEITIPVTVNCVVPNVSVSLSDTTYVSTKWCGCKSSTVYGSQDNGKLCARSPGYWKTSMNVDNSGGCTQCSNNGNSNDYVWPPANLEEYYTYTNLDANSGFSNLFTTGQVCDILNDFNSQNCVKPANGVMFQAYRMLKFLIVDIFNLYNLKENGELDKLTCKDKILALIREAKVALTEFFNSVISKVSIDQDSNFYTAILTDSRALLRTLSNIELENIGFSNVELGTYSNTFNTLGTGLEDFFKGESYFAFCNIKDCGGSDILSSNLKTNVLPSACGNNSIVYTIDLDVEEKVCKTSILTVTIDAVSCDVGYNKEITIKVNYQGGSSTEKIVLYEGEQIITDINLDSSKTINNIEFSYLATTYDLGDGSTTDGDKVVFAVIIYDDITPVTDCLYTNTSVLKDTINSLPNNECAKLLLPCSDITDMKCKEFVEGSTMIILSGKSNLVPPVVSITIPEEEVCEILTAMTTTGYDLNNLSEYIIDSCFFGPYKYATITFVVQVEDCASSVTNCIEIENKFAINNPCHPEVDRTSSNDKSCTTNTFTPKTQPSSLQTGKAKISDAKKPECSTCGKNKVKETKVEEISTKEDKKVKLSPSIQEQPSKSTKVAIVPSITQKKPEIVRVEKKTTPVEKVTVKTPITKQTLMPIQGRVVSPVPSKKEDIKETPKRFSDISGKK